MIITTVCPASSNARRASSTTSWPRWRAGAVGSSPSLTRSLSPLSSLACRWSAATICTARSRRRSKNCPLTGGLGIDGVGAEVLLRVTWKQRLKQGDDGLVGGVHQIDHIDGVVNRVADVLLQRVELRAPDGIGRGAQLVDDHVGEKDRSEHAEDRAEGSVEHHRRDLDLRVRKLGRDLDNHQDREDDPEKAEDPPVGYLKARRLLQDAAGLDTHVGRRPHGDEQSHETDEPPDQAGEEATRGIREDEHDRKNVDPRHLALPPERHADACEIRAGPHSRNLARCLFSSPSLISDMTLSTSASVRVRSGLRKVKVNAMLL